jgi:hypothetical protein
MSSEILFFGITKSTFFNISVVIWIIAAIMKGIYSHVEELRVYHERQITEKLAILSQYMDIEMIEKEFLASEIIL